MKGLEFPGGGRDRGSARLKNVENCMKPNWNFQRDGGQDYKKNPFHWGGMDIFWSYMLDKHNLQYINSQKKLYLRLGPELISLLNVNFLLNLHFLVYRTLMEKKNKRHEISFVKFYQELHLKDMQVDTHKKNGTCFFMISKRSA